MRGMNWRIGLLCLFCTLCLFCAPFIGAGMISPAEIFNAQSPDYLIFWRLRLPRSLAAFLAGAGLSLCGLVFQAMFRNPLATPFTLGISSGAALGAAIFLRLGWAATFLGMAGSLVCALAGCFLSMLMVYGITRARGGFSTAVMLLAGVIINFFFASLVMFVQYISNAQDAAQIMRWLMGTLSGIDPAKLWEMAAAVCAGLWIFARMGPELDLLLTGEELAASRGVDVEKVKLSIFVTASIVVGVIVSITGPIGFVGMMVPQICRLMLGHAHALLVPAAFFLGGGFLAACDVLARSVLAPAELPVGILTAMSGAPFFLWMLFRGNKAGEVD